jgi:WD40 repeat protein
MKKLLTIVLLGAGCYLADIYCAEPKPGTSSMMLQSNDGQNVEVETALITAKSGTIREMIATFAATEKYTQNPQLDLSIPIPLPNIAGNILKTIIDCIKSPGDADQIILSLDENNILKFSEAVLYLDIPELLEKLPAIRWLMLKPLRVLRGHIEPVQSVAITKDEKFIITTARKEEAFPDNARIWDAKTGELLQILDGDVSHVALSGNGKFMFSVAETTAKPLVWNIFTRNVLYKLGEYPYVIYSIAISYSGRYVATGVYNGDINVWDTTKITDQDDADRLYVLRGHAERFNKSDNVRSIAISNDELILVGGYEDRKARIWDIESGKILHELRGHTGPVNKVAISEKNNCVVTASDDGDVRIWDTKTGASLFVLHGHAGPITDMAIDKKEEFIATCSADRTARIWNIKSGKSIHILEGHADAVVALTISDDSKFVLTGGRDGKACVWDVETGHCFPVFIAPSAVNAVAISRDNQFIVTGCSDHSAYVWYLLSIDNLRRLLPGQIALITKIYLQIKQHRKLELSANTQENNDLKQILRTLSDEIQFLLKPFITLE